MIWNASNENMILVQKLLQETCKINHEWNYSKGGKTKTPSHMHAQKFESSRSTELGVHNET